MTYYIQVHHKHKIHAIHQADIREKNKLTICLMSVEKAYYFPESWITDKTKFCEVCKKSVDKEKIDAKRPKFPDTFINQ